MLPCGLHGIRLGLKNRYFWRELSMNTTLWDIRPRREGSMWLNSGRYLRCLAWGSRYHVMPNVQEPKHTSLWQVGGQRITYSRFCWEEPCAKNQLVNTRHLAMPHEIVLWGSSIPKIYNNFSKTMGLSVANKILICLYIPNEPKNCIPLTCHRGRVAVVQT